MTFWWHGTIIFQQGILYFWKPWNFETKRLWHQEIKELRNQETKKPRKCFKWGNPHHPSTYRLPPLHQPPSWETRGNLGDTNGRGLFWCWRRWTMFVANRLPIAASIRSIFWSSLAVPKTAQNLKQMAHRLDIHKKHVFHRFSLPTQTPISLFVQKTRAGKSLRSVT